MTSSLKGNNDLNDCRFLLRNHGGHGKWYSIFKVQKKKTQPRILKLVKISFEDEGEVKAFSNEEKLREFIVADLP